MNRDSWIFLGWSYVVGLLTTGVFYFDYIDLSSENKLLFFLCLGLVSLVAILLLLRVKYFQFKTSLLFLIVGVFVFAPIYFQLRSPQPKPNDISYELNTSDYQKLVVVRGKVLNEPRVTASRNSRFWLRVNELKKVENNFTNESIKQVSGKLYVTLPLLESKNVTPRKYVTIKGFLYEPKNPKNPGQFNFKKYLQEQGSFAGFRGLNIIQETQNQKPTWGWWKIRSRIIRAQVKGLGSPIGQLVSSIVLGRRAVDLPEDIRNLFIKTGLAHVLAASGFHVSLLLGMVLRLTNSLKPQLKLWIGLGCLFVYSCLTGFSPSVIRAVLMGMATLVALCINGKVKPLGSLFLSLIIILLVNPLWIWNLGLQLSFLATLGLIISVPPLEKKLDWMPPVFATIVSVPIAASIWTLPLIIFTFNTISTYSIIVNVISVPLVTVISLGGMISSFISLIFPSIGTICTSVLYYPCLFLLKIIRFFAELPGSILLTGKISLFVLIIIYGLICLIWLNQKWRKRWNILFILAIIIMITPIASNNLNLFQISVLAANHEPIIVIQDRGDVILINSGQKINIAQYNILPFFVSQGINKLDYGIGLDEKYNSNQNWSYIKNEIEIKNLIKINQINNLKNRIIKTNSTSVKVITENILVVKIQNNHYNWLITDDMSNDSLIELKKFFDKNQLNTIPLVLVWSGNKLEKKWLNVFNIQVAIALKDDEKSPTSEQRLKSTYTIEHDGAVTWNLKKGFQSYLQGKNYNSEKLLINLSQISVK